MPHRDGWAGRAPGFGLTPGEVDAIVRVTNNMIAVLDSEGRLIKVAPTRLPFLWRPVGELEGRRITEVATPEHAAYCLSCVRSAIERGEPVDVRYSLPRDGATVWFEGRVTPVGDGTVLWIARDVTDERRTADALAHQRWFLRRVIDLDPNFIFAKDRQGRFTLVNQAVAEAYGTTPEELLGKTDADFNPNREEVEHFLRDDLEVMETRRDKLIPEEAITDATGRVRMLQTIKRAIVSPEGVADQILGVATDITARKQLEEDLAQSRKMEAIGLLAGGVAHDFNNLLTAVLGCAELLVGGMRVDDPLRARAEEIRDAATLAADLTRQLLTFSRRQVMQPRILDLNAVVEGSAKMLRRMVGDDVQLVTDCDPDLGSVRADPVHLQQVIVNLAVNARDAMPRGGRLIITTRGAGRDADAADGAAAGAGPVAVLTVTDTGHGMDDETKRRIFEPFFTTKARGRGTGLGLATVHGIVTQSGGSISVESEPGHGTTFRIRLPRVDAPPDPAGPTASVDGFRGTETLLVVDNERMVRDLACAALRGHGYRVLEADTGTAALRQCADHPGDIHLLLSDVVMPEMSGPTLAGQVARLRPGIRVLYMSGYTAEPFAHPDDFDSGVAILRKPFTLDEIVRRVREALGPAAG